MTSPHQKSQELIFCHFFLQTQISYFFYSTLNKCGYTVASVMSLTGFELRFGFIPCCQSKHDTKKMQQ